MNTSLRTEAEKYIALAYKEKDLQRTVRDLRHALNSNNELLTGRHSRTLRSQLHKKGRLL